MDEKKIDEIYKMAQITLGKQVDKDCTKWAIEEGFFDNFEALYEAGYRKESDTAREILDELLKEENLENVYFADKNGDIRDRQVIRIEKIKDLAKKYGVEVEER